MDVLDSNDFNNGILDAGVVYAVMNQNYHISRNVRAQWFFQHLNKKVSFVQKSSIFQYGEDCEIEIVSVCPQDPPPNWSPETSHLYQYLVTPATNVIFLSHVSKAVYCLDMSPSISAVDIQRGEVMIDQIVVALRNSIEGVVRPFIVPGSVLVFEPDLFVTVIVHTPFFTTPAQQGWRVTATNVEEFLTAIVKQLERLEDTIANVSGLIHDQLDALRVKQAESERLVGGLFEEVPEKVLSTSTSCNTSMVGPDLGFINLLRYGMLALRLLPPNNLSNLVVVTDGMITLPDIDVLDSVLSQLRSNAVAVSFLHIGSQFHPHCCHGLVPYSEIMQFITSATLGAYVPSPSSAIENKIINIYHEMFITWSFRKRSVIRDLTTPIPKHGDWNISNQSFYGNREPQLLTKKHVEENLNVSLLRVLFCRLHEGYMIKNVHIKANDLEVIMVLPWSNHIFIEYIITAQWPEQSENLVHYILSIKAPYEFLHDITCLMKKRFHSPYRQAVVSRFWSTLKTLSHTDLLLSRLDSFSTNPIAFTLPDSIRSGMPLFYLPSNASPPVLPSSGASCLTFAQFWRPVVMLEPSVWQKWFHTHRLGVILQPDRPIPLSLYAMTNNTRIQVLQCRQAAAALFNSLKKITTFVLIENHSFIKIITPVNGDKEPNWFSIIRVTMKPPCAVIHIAFLGGTPGTIRHQVIEAIKEEISQLKIPQRCDVPRKLENPPDTNLRLEVLCCTLLQKPLEKILIRYERMPCEFRTVVFPDGTQPVCAAKPLRPTSTLITTLSRYLHHKRSIWDAHTPSVSHNNSLPIMLTTLTKMRLQEGFRFAHCTAGIINMVLEVQMKCFEDDKPFGNTGKYQPCIVQYVLFPPHMTSVSAKGSNSGDEAADEADVEVRTELITECWIEPQHGVVTQSPPNRYYLENLQYHQIADMIWRVDVECISNLLTFDHLQLMCHNQEIMPPAALDPLTIHQNPLENWPHAVALEDKRIHRIPFAYNLMNILNKCQQAEILSSMFIQELNSWENKCRQDAPNNSLMESFLNHLQELNHRELYLNDHESTQLLQLIMARTRDTTLHPIPFPTRLPNDSKPIKQFTKQQFWRNKEQEHCIPKWRCFIKSMASNHCVLTFVPASYHDLKILMLGAHNKKYISVPFEDNVSSDSREYESKRESNNASFDIENENYTIDNLDILCNNKAYSLSSNKRWIVDPDDESVFDNSSRDILKDFLNETTEYSSFRVRSSSWDTMKEQPEHPKVNPFRARTSSVGSKMKTSCESKRFKLVRNESSVSSLNLTHHPSKKILGSVTLPIYIYNCPLANLEDALIFKSNFIQKTQDVFLDRTIKIETPSLFESGNEDESPADELSLRHHCKVVAQAFNKCFTMTLFKSLHSGHLINSLDIQQSVNGCVKTLLEIDITKYIQTVCGHYKKIFSKDSGLSLSLFHSDCLSQEMRPLHYLIKDKFLEILTSSFKPVPSNPDYYFCCPPFHHSRAVDATELNRKAAESQDYDMLFLQSEMMEFNNTNENIIGGWERVGYVATPDDARTSLLSNMDSESMSDFPEDDLNDEISPLFLYVVCSVQSKVNNFFLTKKCGKIIPTCLGELFDDCSILEDFILYPSSFTISLNLYFLTLPLPCLEDLSARNSDCRYSEQGGLMTASEQQFAQVDHRLSSDGLNEKLKNLPGLQHKSINLCIQEIKWLLQDEIATFLLEEYPVVESSLSFIANHVESSSERYSCILHTLNLDFVSGIEHSIGKFEQELGLMRVPGYHLKKEGDFYYVVKDSDESVSSKLAMQTNWNGSPLDFIAGGDNKVNSAGQLASSFIGSRTSWESDFKGLLNSNLWIMDINHHRINLPNFWLILKVEKEEVVSYFHCRFLDINCDEVQHYREVHARVLKSINDVCKTVNQTLLLQNLYNTRICDTLLEPETNDDIWKPNQSVMNRAKSLEDGVDDINESYLENVSKFLPGCFSCRVVWQAHFLLHPRLKTGPGKTGLSRAIQALRTVLNRFSVNNRTNMFVYQDSTGNNVFYLRLQENIKSNVRQGGIDDDSSPGSVSRSSSINSLNNKKPPDDNYLRDIRPRLKSFGEMVEREYSKQEDFLTLMVHGITEAGAEVKNELVQVLQNRLDDAVLEVLSVMLARNPMCKLSIDDVHFIQKPNHAPDTAVQFTVPEYANKHLQALSYYLRQNMLQFLFLPKYTDSRHQFQDFSEPEGSPKRMSDSTIYLYNQSPASGSKGIACLAIGVLDNQRNVIKQTDFIRSGRYAYEEKIIDDSQFQMLIFTTYKYFNVEPCETEADWEAVIEVRLWKQGRVNMELLVQKLKSAVQFSLWDLNMELNFLTAPLSDQLAGQDIITLHKVYYKVIPLWLQYGNELNVPSVRMNKFSLTSRHAVGVTLKEVHTLVKSYESSSYLFCENADRTSALVYQCGSEFLPTGMCFLVACHPSLWRLTIDAYSSHSEIEGKGQKGIQKFPQLFNSFPDGTIQYVPRQRFLIALINNNEVSLYTYNWAKERVESLIKSLTQLGLWLSARSSFLTGILTQKMGLFHNQPYTRKSTPQLNSADGTELESLLVFSPSVAVKKSGYGSLAGLTQILHDSKPLSFRRRSSDPVTANVYQIVEIRSNENREQQKKLYMMWQSRGATPSVPLTEDILDLFMQYSRIIHYCLTPLLFLPQWRLQSAATRDHSLKVPNTKLPLIEMARHPDDKWHQSLCANFVNEYKQYLQTLGFISIQIAPSTPRKITRSEKSSKSDEKPVCYLQKSLLGGILLFEILLSEPFFHVKLHALECSRLQSTPTISLVSQFTKNFLDECDKVKVLMHLHSFTYDYHLRCLHWYISDRQSLLRSDYHLTSFLDDFLKYYPKAPNYARSLAYSGSLSVSDLITPATQLFDYLLSHGKVYEMEVLRMLPLEVASTSESSQPESEYVLVKLGSTRHVSYKDAQDLNQTDDFDVTLIVSNDETTLPMKITLNYYILVTSRRELYPKLEIEQKLGKFCTVSTANPLSSLQSSAESLDDVFDGPATFLKSSETSQQHVEIKQESVNYLGYYSSHEQLMQQLIMEEASAAKKHIEAMIKKGSVDCRTHILWNKLLSTLPTLTYSELSELKELGHVQSLLGLDSRLSPMLTQPMSWYQGLMKILIAKYADRHRIFTSPDNNTQHLLILHQRFLNGFVMLTIDSLNLSGDLSIVYRQFHGQETDITANDIHSLVEGVVNACCFHIWITLLT